MITLFKRASDLPSTWQSINQHRYLSAEILSILERANPCECQYAIINDRSSFIIYKLKLNLLTYAKLDFALTINVIGIPCSVSESGIKVELGDIEELMAHLNSRGQFSLILNADSGDIHPSLLTGYTLPSCLFDVKWDSFNDYLCSLRSHYRYRFKKAIAKGAAVQARQLANTSQFDSQLYQLYEQVYQASEYKLEKLSIDFFREMPCEIHVFYIADKPIGFVQLLQVDSQLNFVFGGIDYTVLHQYDTYQNLLLYIIRQAIERGLKRIDFGQTAEDSKLKLGCYYHRKYMHVYIKNPLLRLMVKPFKQLLSHQPIETEFKPFKDYADEN